MFYFFVVVMGSFFDPRKIVFPSHIYYSLYGGVLIGYLLWLSYIRVVMCWVRAASIMYVFYCLSWYSGFGGVRLGTDEK